MRIHSEGRLLLAVLLIVLLSLLGAIAWWLPAYTVLFAVVALGFFLLVLQFFRDPVRAIPEVADNLVYAPADGKVVVIEETFEPEYFKEKRLQISIFMSPLNVHVNRNPISGLVKYNKYHPGRYLVAWHPKSSTENERTTVVIDNGRAEVLLRQIAGAVAKRIKNYLREGDRVRQGDDFGFIKFGSRVDLFLPLGTPLRVKIGQQVKGNRTVIAELHPTD